MIVVALLVLRGRWLSLHVRRVLKGLELRLKGTGFVLDTVRASQTVS